MNNLNTLNYMLAIIGLIVKQKVNETQNNQNNALNPNQKRYPL
ncbi:hypothetical protein HMPREF1420_00144 [Helicobacter pylori GAM264Ai]|nr:hypothetical protein HMPREF1406_00989 [Helicobacter pylori GAM239Bi]EMH26904.1 hypothetical protein HMPREF1420_00144 [Helicobacter pylori GAM264Ai]